MLKITNRQARHLWQHAQLLASAPSGPFDLPQMVRNLGYVQIDTIQNVTRAHHHIMWSRNHDYREFGYDQLLGARAVFEHFTHDASILPVEFHPFWQRQFRRLGARAGSSAAFHKAAAQLDIDALKARIAAEGPLSTHDFDSKISGPREMWDRPPHKRLLDQLWYAGDLATSHRERFVKYYDLAENVIPPAYRDVKVDDMAQIDWLCRGALDRLVFASPGEIQRFWGAMDAAEVKVWINQHRHDWQAIEVEAANGEFFSALAPADIEQRLAQLTPVSGHLRIINPFDPLIRDRIRFKRLFGIDYRIEIFVPAAQRQWGYYVYPILARDHFVGRIEIKADRTKSRMEIVNFWSENGASWPVRRIAQLDRELAQLAKLVNISTIDWRCDRPAG